jgi:hypothetical protein
VIRIGVHPAGEESDQHVIRVAPRVSCTTTVREVLIKPKSGLCSRDEVLALSDCPTQLSSWRLILPPPNHLEAGPERFDKVVTRLLGLLGPIKPNMRPVQIKACPSGSK